MHPERLRLATMLAICVATSYDEKRPMNQISQWHRFVLMLVAAAPLLWISAYAGPPTKTTKKPGRSKTAGEKSAEPQAAIIPSVYFMRDPLVQRELNLTSGQQ